MNVLAQTMVVTVLLHVLMMPGDTNVCVTMDLKEMDSLAQVRYANKVLLISCWADSVYCVMI